LFIELTLASSLKEEGKVFILYCFYKYNPASPKIDDLGRDGLGAQQP
jgi:hypothetical protein